MTERSTSLLALGFDAAILYFLSLGLVLPAASFLTVAWGRIYALHWAVGSECIFFSELALVAVLRHFRTKHKGGLLADLDLPDYVTIGRGFIVACAGGFLFVPKPVGIPAWMPSILYLAGIAGDLVDGRLARKFRGPTHFGAILDSEFDSVATLLGITLGIHYRTLPSWYLLAGLAHYIFLAGIFRRSWRGLPVDSLPEKNSRRIIGGASSMFIATAISPLLFGRDLGLICIPSLLLISFSFISDWCSITKRE